jgi:hypothetical protein
MSENSWPRDQYAGAGGGLYTGPGGGMYTGPGGGVYTGPGGEMYTGRAADVIQVPEGVYTRDRVVDFSRVPAPTTTEATSLPGRCLLKNLKNAD